MRRRPSIGPIYSMLASQQPAWEPPGRTYINDLSGCRHGGAYQEPCRVLLGGRCVDRGSHTSESLKVWRRPSRNQIILIYIPGYPKSNSIDTEIGDHQFGTGVISLAGDFQATRVPRVLHMRSTDGDSKISQLGIGIDGQGGNTSRSRANGDTITVIWVPCDCMWPSGL